MGAELITLIRRALVAVLAGMAITAAIRLRGQRAVPPQTGGWRELSDDELIGDGILGALDKRA